MNHFYITVYLRQMQILWSSVKIFWHKELAYKKEFLYHICRLRHLLIYHIKRTTVSKLYITIKIIPSRTPYPVITLVKHLSLLNTMSYFNMIMVKYSANDIICALFSLYITKNRLWNWLSDTLWNLSQPARTHQVYVRIKESMISWSKLIGRWFIAVKRQDWHNLGANN